MLQGLGKAIIFICIVCLIGLELGDSADVVVTALDKSGGFPCVDCQVCINNSIDKQLNECKDTDKNGKVSFSLGNHTPLPWHINVTPADMSLQTGNDTFTKFIPKLIRIRLGWLCLDGEFKIIEK